MILNKYGLTLTVSASKRSLSSAWFVCAPFFMTHMQIIYAEDGAQQESTQRGYSVSHKLFKVENPYKTL